MGLLVIVIAIIYFTVKCMAEKARDSRPLFYDNPKLKESNDRMVDMIIQDAKDRGVSQDIIDGIKKY